MPKGHIAPIGDREKPITQNNTQTGGRNALSATIPHSSPVPSLVKLATAAVPFPLLALPPELLMCIGSRLDIQSRLPFTQVCKTIRETYTKEEREWFMVKSHCLVLINKVITDETEILPLKEQLKEYYPVVLSRLFNEIMKDDEEYKEIAKETAILAEKLFKYFTQTEIRALLGDFLPTVSGDLRAKLDKLASLNLPFCISLVLALDRTEVIQNLGDDSFLFKKLPDGLHEEAKTLFRRVQDRNGPLLEETSILHHAIAVCWPILYALLEASPGSINVANRRGQTLLIHACEKGYVGVAKKLLQQGAQINLKDNMGMTALFHAIRQGNDDLLDILLKEKTLNVEQEMHGATALIYAVLHLYLYAVESLIGREADINTQTADYQQTPLMMTALTDSLDDWSGNNIKIINMLLDNGANINQKDKEGWTALMHAVYQQRLDIAKLLLDWGADRTIRNRNGEKAMDLAQQIADETCRDEFLTLLQKP